MEEHWSENYKLIDLSNLKIPNSIIISKVDHLKAGVPLSSHTHPGCFELCCFYSGLQTYAINKRKYLVRGGDCFFTCPDEPHDTFGTVEEKSGFYYIIFELNPAGDFLLMGAEAASYLYHTFMGAQDRVFHGGKKITGIFYNIMMTYMEKSPFCRARVISLLTELFYQIAKLLQNSKQVIPEIPPGIQEVITAIESTPEISMTIEQMAECSGMSVTSFKQEFKSAKGMSPHDFHMRKRIEKAEQWMTGNYNITDIAFQLGFSSSQHFATVFKKYKGITPTEYKKA